MDLQLPMQSVPNTTDAVLVRLPRRARSTILCDKVCQWLVAVWWFSPGHPVYSANKTDRHGITEILLKVAWNTIRPNQTEALDFIPSRFAERIAQSVIFCVVVCNPFLAIVSYVCRLLTVSDYKHMLSSNSSYWMLCLCEVTLKIVLHAIYL